MGDDSIFTDGRGSRLTAPFLPRSVGGAYWNVLERLTVLANDMNSFVDETAPYGQLARTYFDTLQRRERPDASKVILQAIESGVSIKDIYLHVFQPVLYEIGRLWQCNRLSVVEEHYYTAATQMVMSQLYDRIFSQQNTGPRLIAACPGDELHEVGIRMVADFFELEGWDTQYLGANVPAEAILAACLRQNPDVLALSTTMSYHSHRAAKAITMLRSEESCRDVLVIVGGYCYKLFPELWKEVGADGFAQDAASAVALASQLLRDRTVRQ